MAELKTKQTTESVEKFLSNIADDQRRKDCFQLLAIMKAATKAEPAMWGASIVGFGRYQYAYKSGRSLEWFITGFSPRKQDLTLYIMPGLERYPALMKKLEAVSLVSTLPPALSVPKLLPRQRVRKACMSLTLASCHGPTPVST